MRFALRPRLLIVGIRSNADGTHDLNGRIFGWGTSQVTHADRRGRRRLQTVFVRKLLSGRYAADWQRPVRTAMSGLCPRLGSRWSRQPSWRKESFDALFGPTSHARYHRSPARSWRGSHDAFCPTE